MEGARPAQRSDLDRLVELLRQATAATPQLRGGHLFGRPQRNFDPETRLNDALGSEGQLLLCGTLDEYVVGFALVTVEPGINIGSTGIIEELYVEPDARSVGVGEALVTDAVKWCRRQSCTGVDMPALPGDRATKNLCERSGFSARAIWMHRSL